MRRGDDVLYMTLVDFFIQAFFFVLVVLLLTEVDKSKAVDELRSSDVIVVQLKEMGISTPEEMGSLSSALDALKKKFGIESVADLPDKLTTMVPAESASQAAYIASHGGMRRAEELIKQAEGRGGSDLPSCAVVDGVSGGKPKKKYVAAFEANGNRIVLLSWEQEFSQIMLENGVGQPSIRMSWAPEEFRSAFSPTVQRHAACRYFVHIDESKTELRAPRDAVSGIFYTGK